MDSWLCFHYHRHVNSILIDEIGLRKMVMCIAILDNIIKKSGVQGPFIVITPLSTLANWQREFGNWTNICFVTFHVQPEEPACAHHRRLK
jgi:SNF2 family DNA or RNA helicase